MNPFHVGQRVVFVGADDQRAIDAIQRYSAQGISYPIKGCIYTVRRVGIYRPSIIFLEEIVNPVLPGDDGEGGFHYGYFRPVKDTSIEVFRTLLSPVPEEVA